MPHTQLYQLTHLTLCLRNTNCDILPPCVTKSDTDKAHIAHKMGPLGT